MLEGESGVCEPEGFCSFPSSDCASGRAFEAKAGDLAGMCVTQRFDAGICGAIADPCCEGTCSEGTCVSDLCVECGQIGQSCCGGDLCGDNAFCDTGTCAQCVTEIATGRRHSCVIKQGAVWCFGQNDVGQLGNADVGPPSPTPVQAVTAAGPITDAIAVGAGWEHSCAARADGTVWCWGGGMDGRLGNDAEVNSSTAVQVVKAVDSTPLTDVRELALSDSSTCAVDNAGLVWCWGKNDSGQLGDGSLVLRSAAAEVLIAAASPLTGISKIDAGGDHVCGQQADGSMWCWGRNTNGQIGNGATAAQPFAESVFVAGSFDLGRWHTCAVDRTNSEVSCWGQGWRGRLGNGDTTGAGPNKPDPTPVLDSAGGNPFSAMSVALGGVSCALTSDTNVWCWGNNQYGQTGSGAGAYTPVPVLTESGEPFSGVERLIAAYGRVCSYMTDGSLMCWGRNSEGQLGDGTMTSRGNPVPVTVTCP